MAVTSREGLIQYCLRELGHPVMEINVDVDQVEDRIDDALQYYQDYHFDATEHKFYAHQITQLDLDNGYVTIPEEMIFVKSALSFGGGLSSSSLRPFGDTMASWDFTVNNPFTNMGGAGGKVAFTTNDQLGSESKMSDFFISMQGIENMQEVMGGNLQVPITFSRHANRVIFDGDISDKVTVDEYIILEGWVILDPTVYTDVWNDRWLKNYATALIKRQWGMNLSKYAGIQLPGGVTLDGDKIYEQAKEEIEKLEEEMQLKYELPVDFISG